MAFVKVRLMTANYIARHVPFTKVRPMITKCSLAERQTDRQVVHTHFWIIVTDEATC